MSKTTILIVEDEAIVAADLAGKLGRLGYEVAGTAAKGEEAVALAGHLRPQLVLMDIWLKGPMDGIEAAEAIRRQHDVPVVYLTAHSDPATLARAKLTGPFGYILKPFEERELATQIEMALYRHQADRQLRQQREWLRVTLTSIGDAVIATDAAARITFLNPVAESLTGWKAEEAAGQAIQCVFRIVNEQTGQAAEEPVARVLREGRGVELANHTALVTKDGRTVPIEDSAAPIRDAGGQVIGAVLVFHEVTEKRRAEEALRKSEQEFRTLAEVVPQIVWATRPDGWNIFFNQQWMDYTGLTLDESYGHGWNTPFHPDDKQRAWDAWQRATQHNETYLLECRLRRADGVYRWWLIHGTPMRGANGEIQKWFGTCTDIEEIKQAEEMDRRLAAIVESSSDAILSKTLDGIIRTWNAGAERIYGYTAEEVVGKSVSILVPPGHAGELPQILDRIGRGERIAHFETVRVRKGGEHFPIALTVSPIVDVHGRIVGASTIARDITAQKRAEEALARAARQRALLVELSTRVVAQRSVDELLATVVDAARELTAARLSVSGHGYTGGEFRVGMVSHAEGMAPCPPGEVFKVQKGGVYLEVLHGRPSLRLGEAELSGHPAWWGLPEGHAPLRGLLGARLEDALGQPCGLIMVSDKEGGGDFTADDEAHLRQLASVTSLALGHIEARTAAEAANVAKSQFLANMSHELRTPMNAILGMIDVALPKAADPIVQDCLQTAKGSADLLLTLLNDLLDSARIESGKLELESAPFSLRRMLDQITRVLAVRASEKGLCFYCRMPDETPDVVMGDRMRLQQVLLNLAGNAIKFTERGDIEIGLHALSQGGEACLEFAIRDTGIGVSSSALERLFQPFSQADASMARRFGGTGLGLSISKSLVEMMGGRIWAESELGKGSTFSFTVRLPLTKEVPADFEAPVAVPTATCPQLRILLVEDNPANQKLATYILQDRGHVVEIAGDGQEAICLTGQNRYDVILMDVQMPGMNGLEATAAIRRREVGGSRVPIIAMTAHAMRGDRDRCLAAGMDGYLSKPVNAQEMIGLVESLAGHPPAGRVVPMTQLAGTTPVSAGTLPQATALVFNPAEALTRCFNSDDMVREMMQCFFDEVNNLFPQMRAALEKGDLSEVGRLGHRMKGTVVYLGAEPAKEAALGVERFCKSSGGTPSEAAEAIDALEHECIALKAALRKHPLAAEAT